MKKQLIYLLPLFALCLGAVSIKWFNDYPAGRPLATNDIVAIQRTGPNRYVYGDLNDVKNLIGGGGGGAQVWTNNPSPIISPSNPTNTVLIGSNRIPIMATTAGQEQYLRLGGSFSGENTAINQFTPILFDTQPWPGTANAFGVMTIDVPPPQGGEFCYTNAPWTVGLVVQNDANAPSSQIVLGNYGPNNHQGNIGILSFCNVSQGLPFHSQSCGIQSDMEGYTEWQVGISSFVSAQFGTPTNIGLSSVIYTSGSTETNVPGYFSLASSVVEPSLESCIVMADSFKYPVPLFEGRTNNGSIVFKVNHKGTVISQGSLFPSNSLAIPTAAQIGVGGYWTGNSNGFLVTVYSLDGLSTVMKVLAP